MFEANVLFGPFTCTVLGATVRVRCISGACRESASADFAPQLAQGNADGRTVLERQADGLRKRLPLDRTNLRGESRQIFEVMNELDDRLTDDDGPVDVLKGQILAHSTYNGRADGVKRVICPYCLAVGAVSFSSRRLSPTTVGDIFISEPMNDDGDVHVHKRAIVTYTVLRVIAHLADCRAISASANVTCPGASVQMQKVSTPGFEDAHQVLREFTIDGQYLYKLHKDTEKNIEEKLRPKLRSAMIYCFSVTSHLPAIWNKIDGAIESAVVIRLLLLAQECVSGKLRPPNTKTASPTVIWDRLCEAYSLAVGDAATMLGQDAATYGMGTPGQLALAAYQNGARALAVGPRPSLVNKSVEDLIGICSVNVRKT
jgi:hypothetical protein